MKRREFIASTAAGATALGVAGPRSVGETDVLAGIARRERSPQAVPRILIAGGGFGTDFLAYMAELTGKARPRICYLPTATADRPEQILRWYQRCAPLDVEPHYQGVFISSNDMRWSWEDVFFSMDAIVVSGGNTLNQQAIWRAQGIDEVLREAWRRGVVLGGSSAGSLCWFEEGTTDSRPVELTKIECLGFLPGSHSPHYDAEEQRRPTYHRLIASGELQPGWACDNDAGIYFEGTEPRRFVTTRPGARVYYVDLVDGEVVERAYEPELMG
jgi:peptidase E